MLYGELRTANLAQKQEKRRKNNICQDISRMRGIHSIKFLDQFCLMFSYTKQPVVRSTPHGMFHVKESYLILSIFENLSWVFDNFGTLLGHHKWLRHRLQSKCSANIELKLV